MKKLICLSAALLLAFGAAEASLLDIYGGVTGSVGNSVTFLPRADGGKFKEHSNSFGAVVGVDIPLLRVEGEYGYMAGKDLGLSALMLNGYLKAPIPYVKPYAGVGIGSVLGGKVGGDDAKASSALQGMAGIQFEIPKTSLFIDFEGRLFYAFAVREILDHDIGFYQYDWRMKVRYAF